MRRLRDRSCPQAAARARVPAAAVKAAEAGVARVTWKTAGLSVPVARKRKRRVRHSLVQTFERSRAGELWQSDIRSFLPRSTKGGSS